MFYNAYKSIDMFVSDLSLKPAAEIIPPQI